MDKHIEDLLNGTVPAGSVTAPSLRDLPEDWYEDNQIAFVDSANAAPAGSFPPGYAEKLVSGDAHTDFLKDGCAVYPLSGSDDLKYAADRLLARGINRFVLPAALCQNKELVSYLGRMSLLFDGGKSVPQAALLHCEEALRDSFAGTPQETASALTRAQIDYDIVSSDIFAEHRADLIYERLIINGSRYQALIVPDYARITAPLLGFILAAEETGFPVIFTGQRPSGILDLDVSEAALALLADTGTLVQPSRLAAELISRGICDVRLTPDCPDIVSYHYRRENHMYFCLNESPDRPYEGQIFLPVRRDASIYDAENNSVRPLSFRKADKGILADVRILPHKPLLIVFS